jgi:predicted CoA-binding protein
MTGTLNDAAVIEDLLATPRTWALVGRSRAAATVALGVARALHDHGHRIIPVNPAIHNGGEGEGAIGWFGEPAHAALADVGEPVDVVDIFRRAAGVGELVDEAIPLKPHAIWLQLGAVDDGAARRATDAGIHVVMDRCPKIEYARRALGQ